MPARHSFPRVPSRGRLSDRLIERRRLSLLGENRSHLSVVDSSTNSHRYAPTSSSGTQSNIMIAYSNWKQRNTDDYTDDHTDDYTDDHTDDYTDDYTARDLIFSYMGRDKCHRIHRFSRGDCCHGDLRSALWSGTYRTVVRCAGDSF
jgi:hypothetical protein